MVIPAFFQSRPLQAVAFIASCSIVIDYGLHRAEDTLHIYDLIMSISCGVGQQINAQKIKFKYANYLLLDGGVSHSGLVMP